MMSRCSICGMPTDMALSDVFTDEQIKQLGGVDKIPLIGSCGERECVDKQFERQAYPTIGDNT